MMADTGIGRILTAKVISPAQGYDRGIGNLPHTLSDTQSALVVEVFNIFLKIAVLERWICLVLGLVCMGFGMWGICMKSEQDALHAHIEWLGSLYVPTLRVTAIVCTGLGVMLARRGWAHL
jgi:hypothetical protein